MNIAVKIPLRVSICGGGSDLPEFFSRYGGEVISFAITKYVYVYLAEKPPVIESRYILKDDQASRYLQKAYNIPANLSFYCYCDVDSGSGLGGSSILIAGMLKCISEFRHLGWSRELIAQKGYMLERGVLGRNCGKQDFYPGLFGGINRIRFFDNGDVAIEPISLEEVHRVELDKRMFLVHSGICKNSSQPLTLLSEMLSKEPQDMIKILSKNEIVYKHLLNHNLDTEDWIFKLADLLRESYLLKLVTHPSIENPAITSLRKHLQNNGFETKLCGAGSRGHFFCIAKWVNRREKVKEGFSAIPVQIDLKGLRVNNKETCPLSGFVLVNTEASIKDTLQKTIAN